MRYLSLLLSFALIACATTDSGNGEITVETASRGQALTGASCVVSNGGGSWNVVTPATVVVGAASGDLRVVCDKSGYRTSELIFRPSSGYSGSGMGLSIGGGGGHVGGGLGLSFPLGSSGRRYPPRIVVEMNFQ